MKLSEAIQKYDNGQLLHYLQKKIKNKEMHKEVMQIMKWSDPIRERSCTSLQLALYHNKSKEVIYKLIDIGGRELVMVKNSQGETALHKACMNNNVSLDVISKLIQVGGRELVMVNCLNAGTALRLACMNKNVSLDVISKLIEVGGRELVMVKGRHGYTALHFACCNTNASIDIIAKLISLQN